MNPPYTKESLTRLLDDSSNLSINQIKRLLDKMNSAELAHCLESSPPKQRKFLWSLIDNEDEGDVLADLGDEIQQELLLEISNEELSEVVSDLELDEIVDILQHLPEKRMNMILAVLEKSCGFILGSKDVFLNITGGIKIELSLFFIIFI